MQVVFTRPVSKMRSAISSAALATLLVCSSVLAQGSSGGLFQRVPKTNVTADQGTLADAYSADEGTAAVRTVVLDVKALLAGAPLTLNTFEDAPKTTFAMVRATLGDEECRLWSGETATGQTSLMIINGDMVSGFIDQGDQVFEVRPLGGGLHALITLDLTQFPDEDPAGNDVEIQRTQGELDALIEDLAEDFDPLADPVRQDVIVAYTSAMAAKYADPKGHILLAVERANLSNRKSGVKVVLNPVHIYQTSYSESGSSSTDVNRFQKKNDGHMDEIHTLRKKHCADMCMLVTATLSGCGRAKVIYADKASEAFAVTKASCAVGNLTFAHEFGHLQGARHNKEKDSSTLPFAYGHGFWNSSKKIRTVMSYADPCSTCTRVPRWSGPTVKYGSTTMGDSTVRNNARVLNVTASKIAGHCTTPSPYSGVWRFGKGGYYLWVNASWKSFKNKWKDLAKKNLRLVDVEITGQGKKRRYSGVWRAGKGGYYLWVNASWKSFKKKWKELGKKNLRLVDLEVQRPGLKRRYTGVWLPGKDRYALWVNASWSSFKKKWKQLAKKNLRLVDLEITGSGTNRRYSGVWRGGKGGYYLWVNASWPSFQKKWKSLAKKNLRLVDLEVRRSKGVRRYSGVWLPGKDPYALWVNASWPSFKNKWGQLAKRSLRLIDLDILQNGLGDAEMDSMFDEVDSMGELIGGEGSMGAFAVDSGALGGAHFEELESAVLDEGTGFGGGEVGDDTKEADTEDGFGGGAFGDDAGETDVEDGLGGGEFDDDAGESDVGDGFGGGEVGDAGQTTSEDGMGETVLEGAGGM